MGFIIAGIFGNEIGNDIFLTKILQRCCEAGLGSDRNLNLHDIILNPVNDGFVDAFFIGKTRELQLMLPGIGQNLLIAERKAVPASFVKGSQIVSFGLHVQPLCSWKKGDFNK